MKKFLKIITFYELLYPFYKKSFLYQFIKKSYAQIANMLSGFPSKDFVVIWVTGTDWKTTTSNILHKIINDNLGKTLMISTAYIKLWDQKIFNKTKMTSLDVFDLQWYLSTAKDNWCQYAVLEVSSHALDQYRFEGVEFDGAILTNITPEHLDYHGTLENYAKTKRKLFEYVATNSKNNKRAALPKDDEFGRKRADEIWFDKMLSFSINSSSMLRAVDIQLSLEKTVFTLQYLGKEFQITTGLLWEHNVYNILAATAMGILMGIDITKIIASIQSFEGVSGRLEYIDIKGVHIFVDFAHTPNALESTLKFFKAANKSGKLITVFWAPGKRDKFKRPLMGEIADRYSDVMIVTDDDADTENRLDIISQIVQNIKRKEGDNYFIIPERKFALTLALDIAKPWDFIVLAGKGHEKIQLTNFGKRERNDKEQILELASKR